MVSWILPLLRRFRGATFHRNLKTFWKLYVRISRNIGVHAYRWSISVLIWSNTDWEAGLRYNLQIIIVIAFKGAIRSFLQSPHSAANSLQHIRSSDLGAIVCKSHATHLALIMCKCHVKCHLVRRDSSAIKFDRVEIAFI